MAEGPKSEYEAPSIEEVETEDASAVTAAGLTSDLSDRRLKHALRPLEDTITQRR
jgi:hypothetical protein